MLAIGGSGCVLCGGAIKRYRPGVVLAHNALPDVYSRLVAATRGVRVVTVLHSATDDFADPRLRLAERVLQRRTALVVAQQRNCAQSTGPASAKTRRSLVPNGVDATGPRRQEYRRTPSRVVTVARAAFQKNPGLWLEVADLAGGTGIDADFVWFGPESEAVATETLRAGTRGRANACYPGPTDQALAEMLAADIPFRPADREAQGIVPIEAASVGLLVVCAERIDRRLPLPVAAETFQAGDPQSGARHRSWRRYARSASHNPVRP